MKCRKCGKEFHYCSSCCSESCHDMKFCSDKCWKSSEEHKNRIERFRNFLTSLSEDQFKVYEEITGDVYLCEYEFIYDDIIEQIKKEKYDS